MKSYHSALLRFYVSSRCSYKPLQWAVAHRDTTKGWALLGAGVHQANSAADAELLSREHLNLHVEWHHNQFLQTKPLHCTGKPGRVMGVSSCTAGWQHYICPSQKLQLDVTPLWKFGSKASVLSLPVMVFKSLATKGVLLEKKTSYFFIGFLTGTGFCLVVYIAYDKGI